MQSLSELVKQAATEISGAADLAALDAVRVRYLGKKGELTARLKGLSDLPAEERPSAGQDQMMGPEGIAAGGARLTVVFGAGFAAGLGLELGLELGLCGLFTGDL